MTGNAEHAVLCRSMLILLSPMNMGKWLTNWIAEEYLFVYKLHVSQTSSSFSHCHLHPSIHDLQIACSQLVEKEFNHLYPGEVEAIHLVYDCDDLDKLVTEYDKLKGKALDLIDAYATKMRRGKKIKRKTVGPMPSPLKLPKHLH